MKQSLQLRIGQSLTMTPQLQQAIKLLQLSSLELQTEIQATLDANPLLEQDDNLGEITVIDVDANREGGANGEDITEFRTPESKISENRAEQVLPDELEIDARWEQIYDNLPSSPGQSAGSGLDNRDMFLRDVTLRSANDHVGHRTIRRASLKCQRFLNVISSPFADRLPSSRVASGLANVLFALWVEPMRKVHVEGNGQPFSRLDGGTGRPFPNNRRDAIG